jgi:hypothetical protein
MKVFSLKKFLEDSLKSNNGIASQSLIESLKVGWPIRYDGKTAEETYCCLHPNDTWIEEHWMVDKP